MRAKLFFTILITYISIIVADSTTISGTIKDHHSNIPLSNVKIVITRIGDSVSVNDTVISSADGSYSFNYLFELDNYKKKYNQIRIEPLDNASHWFHAERYNYTYRSQTSTNLIGISNTIPDSTKIEGYTWYNTTEQTSKNLLLNEYKVIYTQTSEDSTEIKIDTITVGIYDTYEFYINIKKYKHFKLDLSSNKWQITEKFYYWDYLHNLDIGMPITIPVDSGSIKLSGKINIIGELDANSFLAIKAGSKDIHPIGPNGEFIHYISKGWSGTLVLISSDYTWVSEELTFTNIQEDQILNLSVKKNTHTINGYVTIDKGDSIKNVLIDFGEYYTTTDSLGFYSIEMSHNSHFEITPFKDGYTFNSNTFIDLTCASDITLNLTAEVTKEVTITGTINNESRGNLDSVLILFSGTGNGSCFTDVNGNFSHTLRYDWSGTITPVKQETIFSPSVIPVKNLNNDTIISPISAESPVTSIYEKPIKLDKIVQPEFEIVIFNISGRLIGRAKNIEIAKILTRNAPGLYLYQRIMKNTTIKAKNKMFIK